jgi:hypothetical protein
MQRSSGFGDRSVTWLRLLHRCAVVRGVNGTRRRLPNIAVFAVGAVALLMASCGTTGITTSATHLQPPEVVSGTTSTTTTTTTATATLPSATLPSATPTNCQSGTVNEQVDFTQHYSGLPASPLCLLVGAVLNVQWVSLSGLSWGGPEDSNDPVLGVVTSTTTAHGGLKATFGASAPGTAEISAMAPSNCMNRSGFTCPSTTALGWAQQVTVVSGTG